MAGLKHSILKTRGGGWPMACLTVALFVVTGCASVPFDAPKTVAYAEPPSTATRLGSVAQEWFDRADGASGFVPLASGQQALGARLRMIDNASRTIDLQYFLMKPDFAAAVIADALMRAADRGVRVRLLLDDVFTTVPDDILAIVDGHPNIEIRVFNPVARGGPGWAAFLAEFPRTNRRMHNKAFIVDNAGVILGGRNIADEYYEINEDIEFADFDLFGIGPVAIEASRIFDEYWNNQRSVPVSALIKAQVREAALGRNIEGQLELSELEEARQIYEDAVDDPFLADLRAGRIEPINAGSRVVSDPAEKLQQPKNSGFNILFDEIRRRMLAAEREVIIVSPYFVPRREGVELFKTLRGNGVDVHVITNSLGSTNHAYVHGGYFPYRRELLEAGVQLYEAKVDSAVSSATGEPALLTLHSKAILIDRETAFIGSMNFDPRSIEINSEMGVFVDSRELSSPLAEGIDEDILEFLYVVELDRQGNMIWRHGAGAGAEIRQIEPDASLWRKFVATMASILPIESQL